MTACPLMVKDGATVHRLTHIFAAQPLINITATLVRSQPASVIQHDFIRSDGSRALEKPIESMIHGTQCTWLGELRIPFAFHVHQPSSATLPDASFHQFTRLPTELQLQVFRSCDKPTLFQLMHTSRPIRTEATKLFFSDPEAWYIVDGLWFAEGAHPTDGVHDMDFLHYIQRLHIQFEMFVFPEGPLIDDDLRNVWDRIQFVFPRVSCIMISDALSSVPPPESHKRFCGLCPPAIDVFLSLLVRSSRHGRRKRIIWRRVAMEEDQTGLQEVDGCQIYSEPSIMVRTNRYMDSWEWHNSPSSGAASFRRGREHSRFFALRL